MIPGQVLLNATADLLAADTATLAAAAAMHVHLVVSPFTPQPGLALGTLTLATFTGGAAKNAGIGAQTVVVDPITGKTYIQLLEPAGGWSWLCTVTPGAAETVYGFVCTDNADAVVIGSALINPNPVINAAGQGFSVGYIRLTLNDNPWS